jgi:hypothetical protein
LLKPTVLATPHPPVTLQLQLLAYFSAVFETN